MTPTRGAARRAALALLGVLLAGPAAAQDGDALPLLALDLSQRLEATTGSGAEAVTGLAFSFRDATPVSEIAFGLRGGLRLGEEGARLDGPALTFGYGRDAPGESLSLSASLRQSHVADLSDLSGLVGEDGVIVLPPDFDRLSGEGTRREATLGASLAWREDRPLGFEASAEATAVAYEDATSPDLVDSRRAALSFGLRADLGAGRSARATLRYSILDEEGEPRSDALGLDLAVSADRPRGPLTAALSLSQDGDGLAAALSFGRTLELPAGAVAGSLGLALGADGAVRPTATLSLRRATPRATLALSLAQALRAGEGDEAELATTLTARADWALGPRLGVTLDALYAATDPLGDDDDDGDGARRAEAGVAARLALSPDWGLDAGLRAGLDDDDEADGRVFLGLSRRFEGTF